MRVSAVETRDEFAEGNRGLSKPTTRPLAQRTNVWKFSLTGGSLNRVGTTKIERYGSAKQTNRQADVEALLTK